MMELLLLSFLSQEALPPGAVSRVRFTTAQELVSIAVSPDTRLVATGYSAGAVNVWDVDSRKLLFEDTQKEGGMYSLAFSPDGSLLAAATNAPGRWVTLLDVPGKRLLPSIPPGDTVIAVAVRDGKTIATGMDLGSVAVWDVATSKKLLSLKDRGAQVTAVSCSPDGSRIAAGDWDGSVTLWDSTTGKELQKLPWRAVSLAFSPDGKTLAIGTGSEGIMVLHDVVASREKVRLQGDNFGVNALSFSPDGTLIASSESYVYPGVYIGPKPEHAVHVWQAATGKKLRTLSGGHSTPVQSLVFRPDGTSLVSASRDGTVMTWDLRKK